MSLDIARNFGHGAGFGILLWLIAPIMYLVLGFGASVYKPVTGRASGGRGLTAAVAGGGRTASRPVSVSPQARVSL